MVKLEIGKEYVTRSGLKVKVYDIAESGDFPVVAGLIGKDVITPISYTLNGRYHDDDELSSEDIVGEWQEPLDFDWSCLPAWANEYIAMDESGVWCFYKFKPTLKGEYWSTPDSSFYTIPTEYTPKNFKGSWENSLFKNPNIKN